jgi:hypothetical protein
MMTLVLVGMVVLACAGFVLAWLEWRASREFGNVMLPRPGTNRSVAAIVAWGGGSVQRA